MRIKRFKKRGRCHVTGKARYRDAAAAAQVLRYWREAAKRRDAFVGESIPARAYLCEHCRGYHLTKQG